MELALRATVVLGGESVLDCPGKGKGNRAVTSNNYKAKTSRKKKNSTIAAGLRVLVHYHTNYCMSLGLMGVKDYKYRMETLKHAIFT